MTWSRDRDEIVVRLSRQDYDQLLFWLGCVGGQAHRDGDLREFYATIDFVNRMNVGNPGFTPYELPPDWRTRPTRHEPA